MNISKQVSITKESIIPLKTTKRSSNLIHPPNNNVVRTKYHYGYIGRSDSYDRYDILEYDYRHNKNLNNRIDNHNYDQSSSYTSHLHESRFGPPSGPARELVPRTSHGSPPLGSGPGYNRPPSNNDSNYHYNHNKSNSSSNHRFHRNNNSDSNRNKYISNQATYKITVGEKKECIIHCKALGTENKRECVRITFPVIPLVLEPSQMKVLLKELTLDNITSITQSAAAALMLNIGKIKNNLSSLRLPSYLHLPIPLAIKLTACFEKFELTSMSIGNICFGIQNLDGDAPSTKLLVSCLVSEISKSNAVLNGIEISNACCGLSGLDATHDATKALVNVLASKAGENTDHLNEICVTRAISGLKNLIGTEESTKRLCRALAKRISISLVTLESGICIKMCFRSFRNLVDCEETRELVSTITSKLDLDKTKAKNSAYLPTYIYGLRNLHPFEVSTRALIDALSSQISIPSENWSAFHIDIALQGLRGVDNTSKSGKFLVDAVTKQLIKSQLKLNKHNLGHIFYAMEHFSATINDDTTQTLIRAIITKLFKMIDPEQEIPSRLTLKFVSETLTQLVYSSKTRVPLSTASDAATGSFKEMRKLYDDDETEERLYYSIIIHCMFYFVNDMTSAKDLVRTLLAKDKIKFCKRFQKVATERRIEVDLHGQLPISAALIVKCLTEDVCAVELDEIDSIHYHIGNGHHPAADRIQVFEVVKQLVTSPEFIYSHKFTLLEEGNNSHACIKLLRSTTHIPITGGSPGCLGIPKIGQSPTTIRTNHTMSLRIRESRKRLKDRDEITNPNESTMGIQSKFKKWEC